MKNRIKKHVGTLAWAALGLSLGVAVYIARTTP